MSNPPKADELARWLLSFQNRSADFVRVMFDVEPDPWQIDALNALDSGSNVAIRSGHGVGKTTLMAWAVIQTVACFPYCKVPCTAPTQHQLSDLLWAEISHWLHRSKLKGVLTWTATKLGMKGFEESWFAVARASNKAENLAGFHAPKLRYFVDEGSGVEDVIFEAVDGALTTEGAQCLTAGNPTKISGYFYDAFHRARSQWHTINVSCFDSPRVKASYAEGMATKWGEDSDVYRVRVLGEFPKAESDSFISLSFVDPALTRHTDFTPGLPCDIGVDVARYGSDETVYVVRRGGRVELIERHKITSIPTAAGRSIQLAKEWDADAVKVDDSGLGGGVTDLLTEAQGQISAQIIPCNFGGPGDDHYANEAGLMWGNLRELFRTGDISLPDEPDLVGQLTTRKYAVNSKGKIALENKEDMKRRGVSSPDIADALALAFFRPIREIPESVTLPYILPVRSR